jgi:hypothetical protein
MLHFSETAPFPCTPTPREQGKARPQNKKEQPVGLHFDFARRLSQSYILKLLDRRRAGSGGSGASPLNRRPCLASAPGRVVLSSVLRRTAPAHVDIAPPLHSICIAPRVRRKRGRLPSNGFIERTPQRPACFHHCREGALAEASDQNGTSPLPPYQAASYFAILDKRDEAFEWLKKAYATHDPRHGSNQNRLRLRYSSFRHQVR